MSDDPARKRLKADAAKAAILEAGIEILNTRGPTSDPLGVELTEAIAITDVPRSTAYRLFAHDDKTAQESFAHELIIAVFGSGTMTDIDGLRQIAIDVFGEYSADLFEAGSPIELAIALRELVRRITAGSMAGLRDEPSYWIYMGAFASLGTEFDNEAPGTVAEALAEGEASDEFIAWYQALTNQFGLRLKSTWTWSQFDATAATTVLGTALRSGLNPHLQGIMRPTGPDGEVREWTSAGVLFEGLILTALEPNPRVVNAADLSSWIG